MRQSLRFAVLERDGFRCRYCGKSADDGAVLHVDHIHPRVHDGSDELENLVTACFDCNLGKGKRLLGVIEQPVVFRGKKREMPKQPEPIRRRRKHRGRKYPVVELSTETWEVGSHCATPLKVAAIGFQYGIGSYRQAWEYVNNLGVGQIPPHRMKDAAWYRLLAADMAYAHEMARTLLYAGEPA